MIALGLFLVLNVVDVDVEQRPEKVQSLLNCFDRWQITLSHVNENGV